MSFPPSAACKFLDLPPVNLRNFHLHLTKNPFAGRPPHLCGIALMICGCGFPNSRRNFEPAIRQFELMFPANHTILPVPEGPMFSAPEAASATVPRRNRPRPARRNHLPHDFGGSLRQNRQLQCVNDEKLNTITPPFHKPYTVLLTEGPSTPLRGCIISRQAYSNNILQIQPNQSCT